MEVLKGDGLVEQVAATAAAPAEVNPEESLDRLLRDLCSRREGPAGLIQPWAPPRWNRRHRGAA